ncbi:MAG: four helix bundle protein [Crocinitomicaceae bacterium]
MNDYKNLDVWHQSMKISKLIYANSRLFPKDERFGLTSQIRRASVSVMSNLAEGCGRRHRNDRLQFFYISRGSLYEVECQLLLAQELGFIGQAAFELSNLNIQKCKKILNGFIAHQRKTTHLN